MDVTVKHNGSSITSHVVRYDREAKICTGIGMLELEVAYTYGGTFDPWDSIDIYENGSHAGKYYVSSASEGQPSATLVIQAQDNSKRLSDYFITDSYFIDYPSYTRYWIELFLTEVGINYTFLTDSMGSLLSNNTSLGLMSAYEQIIMLLQMSGWYIRFNPSGTAIIGKLDVDKAKMRGSMGNRDIIEIKVDKNDRMYRNRVVIWGNGDPSTSRWVFAEVERPTKWDYDSRDKRTILISNSNIPTVADAFSLANQAITEFARLNVEKYMTVEDARNIFIGDAISIKSKVFTGKALVTTFGTSMSKNGLVSNIACDERCPRLFGFYNPGGYVYVGTYGSGVWRKHILDYSQGVPSGVVLSGLATDTYSGGWFDCSSGLMDMNVTDLHVNNGVLAAVTSDGGLYYSLEDAVTTSGLVWSGIMLSGLQVVYSGELIEPTVYSGLMGRACIIDRDTNFLRYAVDTSSGLNMGDFLEETDPINNQNGIWYTVDGQLVASGTMLSGFMPSGRSWIIDANPYDGTIANTYPINVSGNYNFTVYDIENDGTTDYAEVMTFSSGVIPKEYTDSRFGGRWVTSFATYVGGNAFNDAVGGKYDNRYTNAIPYSGYYLPSEMSIIYKPIIAGAVLYEKFGVAWDTMSTGAAYHAFVTEAVSHAQSYLAVTRFTYTHAGTPATNEYVVAPTGISPGTAVCVCITRDSDTVYNFYFIVGYGQTELYEYKFDITTLTYTSRFVVSLPPYFVSGENNKYYRITVNDIVYITRAMENATYGFDLFLDVINPLTGTVSTTTMLSKSGTGWSSVGDMRWSKNQPFLFLDGDIVGILFTYSELTRTPGNEQTARMWRYYSSTSGEDDTMVYDWGAVYGPSSIYAGAPVPELLQSGSLGKSSPFFEYGYGAWSVLDLLHTRYETIAPAVSKIDGFTFFHAAAPNDFGIAKQPGGSLVYMNPTTCDVISVIPDPVGYQLLSYSGKDSYSNELFFKAVATSAPNPNKMISMTVGGQLTRVFNPANTADIEEDIVGNFRHCPGSDSVETVHYAYQPDIYGYYPSYRVLQRDGYDFNTVKSGVQQERLDISIYSPLVTMGRQVSSAETYFISMDGSVIETSNPAMSGINLGVDATSGIMFYNGALAEDYRYSDFENTAESGIDRRLFVVYSGNVGSTDIYSLSTFSGEFLAPSGYATRIEMSNFSLPDQYIFVSVSGYTQSGTANNGWGFFQKSPSYSGYQSMSTSGLFVDYSSGYPQARTTIIRLDDSI